VNEATMLDTLRKRYANDDIYTAIGPVCIAINPYRPVASCTSEAITKLCEAEHVEQGNSPPHCFRTAAASFEQLKSDRQAQSILISGESGAGKTETNKICLSCLAELSKSSGKATEACLEAGLVLEVFGNAKTVYNDNSSRFGKWCAVHFSGKYQIYSCSISFYLLELSRIVNAPEGERNYHLFYQMLSIKDAGERDRLKLLAKATDYTYLANGVTTVDKIDDAQEWTDTLGRLDVLDLKGEKRGAMLQLFSSVLLFGNLEFQSTGESTPSKITSAGVLDSISALIKIPAKTLEEKLTTRIISSGKGKSSYTVNLKAAECVDSRDAVAKAVYVALFGWIVEQLNEAQKPDDGGADMDEERYVGLLDIFGFENFTRNSFEQLCINFTNEKLQMHFMDALVRLQQQEYKREGITCDHIAYPDNSAQLLLLDHKSQGVYAMLDDECSVPGGSEEGFVQKLHTAFLGKNALYDKPKKVKGGNVGHSSGVKLVSHGNELDRISFVVVHYAGPVMYTGFEWLEKNRGRLHPDLAFTLSQSDNELCRELFKDVAAESAKPKKDSVGMIFRKSLRQLSATMMQTHQQYIRCIKPNGIRKADQPNGQFMLRQLRYTGVSAVVQIQRSGYPISLTHTEFIRRYRCIAFEHPALIAQTLKPAEVVNNLLKSGPGICKVEAEWLDSKLAQVGVSKIYMREDVMRALEGPRRDVAERASKTTQRFLRGIMVRKAVGLWKKHKAGAAAVREALEKKDLSAAGEAVDALAAVWEASGLKPTASPLLPPLHAELGILECELQALEQGLQAEEEALAELQEALEKASQLKVGSKEAYVMLKVALQSAQSIHRGLLPELTEAMEMVQKSIEGQMAELGLAAGAAKALQGRLRKASVAAGDPAEAAAREAEEMEAMAREAEANEAVAAEQAAMRKLAEWEAEVEREAAAREAARRQKQLELEEEMTKSAEVEVKIVTLRNMLDPQSSVPKQLVGYTEKSTGVAFSEENNTVIAITPGGTAALDGEIRVGDIVLSVDGARLAGAKLHEVLRKAKKKAEYKLTVARSLLQVGQASRTDDADKEGWLLVQKAKNGKSLQVLSKPRKSWVVLKGDNVEVYDGAKRAGKKPAAYKLNGATCKTPLKQLRGQELKQPPVIQALLVERRFPFTLEWKGNEVEHDVVLAATTGEDCSAWCKSINTTLRRLNQSAPTSGWLTKEGGRSTKARGGLLGGLKASFASAKRRWFVLTNAEDGNDATFRYYDKPMVRRAVPLGAVVLNASAQLNYVESAAKDHSFCIVSQGENDPSPVTTVLSAPDGKECGKWMKALAAAIKSCGGETDVEHLQTAHREATRRRIDKNKEVTKLKSKNGAKMGFDQLAELEPEELDMLKEKQLRKLAAHLDLTFDFTGYKHKDEMQRERVINLIISKRRADKVTDQMDLW
jgi:hypothetical protein